MQNEHASLKERLLQKLKYYYLFSESFYHLDKETKKIARKGYRQSLRNVGKSVETEDYPVDFVVTWVDDSDPEWLHEKEKYQPRDNVRLEDDTAARYRDWDMFHYWFRAVEAYAPWVRNIYLVTCGHLPPWLDTSHPKLKIVKHSDYIPDEYLPTFNSHVVELNLWRIPGLSEHLVYFNDDMFLTQPVEKSAFFCDGLPVLYPLAKPYKPKLEMSGWDYARFNNVRACNSKFDVREVMESHPEKWFSHQFSKDVKYNIRAYEDGFLPGMVTTHTMFYFRKSSMEQCAQRLQEYFDLTCSHRFRTNDDLNPQIFEMWDMMHNNFEPGYPYGRLLNLDENSFDKAQKLLYDPEICSLCLNDTERIAESDYEHVREEIRGLLREKYPQKSSFER